MKKIEKRGGSYWMRRKYGWIYLGEKRRVAKRNATAWEKALNKWREENETEKQ